MRHRLIAGASAVAVAATGACASAEPEDDGDAALLVAAASSMRPALEELGRVFTEETAVDVVFSFHSSGILRDQILGGAPYDVYVSAEEAFVEEVVASEYGDGDSVTAIADGQLAIVVPTDRELPRELMDLEDPSFARIAIANPRHAPYGIAARKALESVGVYDESSGRFLFAENVEDAYRIVRSGNADAGVVAASLPSSRDLEFAPVPSELHEPIRHSAVVINEGTAPDAAEAFLDFLTGATGQEILADHGLAPPGHRDGDR